MLDRNCDNEMHDHHGHRRSRLMRRSTQDFERFLSQAEIKRVSHRHEPGQAPASVEERDKANG